MLFMNLNKTIVDSINKIQLSNFLFFYIIENNYILLEKKKEKEWWSHQDSHLGPSGYEPDALTN